MRPVSMIRQATGEAGAAYVSKTDMVAALIREQIITGELAAGEQLRQRDLAQRFGVSQTPVREAMRRLESEGLLVCDTHRGFTVAAPELGRRRGADVPAHHGRGSGKRDRNGPVASGEPLMAAIVTDDGVTL